MKVYVIELVWLADATEATLFAVCSTREKADEWIVKKKAIDKERMCEGYVPTFTYSVLPVDVDSDPS